MIITNKTNKYDIKLKKRDLAKADIFILISIYFLAASSINNIDLL